MSNLNVAVHGLGYVGMVSAACLADHGHSVVGIDIDRSKVDMVNAGRPTVVEPDLAATVERVTDDHRLVARHHNRTLLAELSPHIDVHLICVGTPSTANGSPDTTAVAAVVENIVGSLAESAAGATGTADEADRFPVIVVRSTVLPGTVEQLRRSMDERYSYRAAVDFGLAMCPEFLREASAVSDFNHPPFTVAGVSDPRSAELLERLFAFTGQPFHTVTVNTAEAIKYACNAFHALKVTFANEIGRWSQACGAHGQSVMEIFCQDAQLNISPAYLRPGFAFGGSCLPKDLRAMVHHGSRLDLDLPLLASVLPSNDSHLDHAIRLIDSYRPQRVALLGLAFKSGTDDVRESPYVRIAESLIGRGVDVEIWDPDLDRAHLRGTNLSYLDRTLPHLSQRMAATPEQALDGCDAALLGTTHPQALDALAARPEVPVVDAMGSLSVDLAERARPYVGVAW